MRGGATTSAPPAGADPTPALRKPMPRHPSLAVSHHSIHLTAKQKGDRSLCRPASLERNDLLQVGHRGQVSRELHDAGCAAPIGSETTRVDGSARGGSSSRPPTRRRVVPTNDGSTICFSQHSIAISKSTGYCWRDRTSRPRPCGFRQTMVLP